jgi:hypothetical protein
MQTCKKCSVGNSDDAKFCKSCGGNLSVIICSNCHKENDQDAVFCQECGMSLKDLSKAENIAAFQAPKNVQSEHIEEVPPTTSQKIVSSKEEEKPAPRPEEIESPKEETTTLEKNPLRKVYVPSLLFGFGMALFISILQVASGPYNNNDLFFTGISNVFVYGAVYSLFILVWRRYYKKTVGSIKNPDSGLKAFLIHIGCIIIIMLVTSFSLLTPALTRNGTSAITNNRTLKGCDPSIVGKWGGWVAEEPNTYNYLTLQSDGTFLAHIQKPDTTNEVYKGTYSCEGSKFILNGTPTDYSLKNGVLIIGSETYTRK